MRNLKRALSLALASVMLMGMMVVGAGAKGIDDYSDKAEIVNQDAVAVTTELGIFEGYEDGSFGPEKVVTRAEMAVIICKMLYGSDVNAAQFVQTSVFTDVPAWAAGYVNLCASLNIVAGVGDNKYDPNSTVTTAQAALMLSKALGYFKNEADYGSNWMLASTSKATQLGLYGSLDLAADQGLTRQDVAVMTFNALTQAVPVDYSEMFNVYFNTNSGLIYGLEFNYLETLGYTNFDLVYKRGGVQDAQGRPAMVWGTGTVKSNDKNNATDEKGDLISSQVTLLARNEIITVAMNPDYIYTGGTKAKAIYTDLSKDVCALGTDWTVYYNGEELGTSGSNLTFNNAKNGKDDADFAMPAAGDKGDYNWIQNGEVAEVFLEYTEKGDPVVTVVIYGNYLAKVARVSGETMTLNITNDNTKPRSLQLDEKTFDAGDYKVDDLVVYTIGYDDDDNEFSVFSVATPETTEGAMTAYSVSNWNVHIDKVKTSLSYHYNNTVDVDMSTATKADKTIELDGDYRYYLDPNGYVLAMEPVEEQANRYLYVKSIDSYLTRIEADVVFADGTKETISISEIYDYTRELSTNPEKDYLDTNSAADTVADLKTAFGGTFVAAYRMTGTKYILTIISDNADVDAGNPIKNKESSFTYAAPYTFPTGDSTTSNKVRLTSKTIFVDIDSGKVYEGYDNVPSYVANTKGAVTAGFGSEYEVTDANKSKLDSYADVVFITNGDADGESKTYVWQNNATGDAIHTTKVESTEYYEHENTYVNGVKERFFLRKSAGKLGYVGLYAVDSIDSNDNAKTVTALITIDTTDNKIDTVYSGSAYKEFYQVTNANIDSITGNTIYLKASEAYRGDTIDSIALGNAKVFYIYTNSNDIIGRGSMVDSSAADIVTKAKAEKDGLKYYTEVFVLEFDKTSDEAEIVYIVEVPVKAKSTTPTNPTTTLAPDAVTGEVAGKLQYVYYGASNYSVAGVKAAVADYFGTTTAKLENFSLSGVTYNGDTYGIDLIQIYKTTINSTVSYNYATEAVVIEVADQEGNFYTLNGTTFTATGTTVTIAAGAADKTYKDGFYAIDDTAVVTGTTAGYAGTAIFAADKAYAKDGETITVTVTAPADATPASTTNGITVTVSATNTTVATAGASFTNAELIAGATKTVTFVVNGDDVVLTAAAALNP